MTAYLLNAFALGRVRASTTAFYIFAQPFITAVAAWWVLGERLEPELIPAALGLLVGLALVVRPGRRARPSRSRDGSRLGTQT